MTGENVTEHETVVPAAGVSAKTVDDQLIDELAGRPRPRRCS
ncbi:hypothetical protein OH738_39300 [Streptomyces hirsutus]|uniref:Uncharacterized protein n=1 Tax=Streptomyces hirsutus TaxID=35620 RepID=A0ABZ1GGJ5_9ACTN|nr:hypothetical protein [Streptomyces hirsutus]WSD04427.1 hypothetical protein OIE73_00660 [Streptomyces hirsutus]WTD22186.1 hypothetical protein OH738_39300 [Streptomyces hirsutus]WTD72742.1 hypothetical protein OHB56_01185 [Streptomyces sp. NBC_01635]